MHVYAIDLQTLLHLAVACISKLILFVTLGQTAL